MKFFIKIDMVLFAFLPLELIIAESRGICISRIYNEIGINERIFSQCLNCSSATFESLSKVESIWAINICIWSAMHLTGDILFRNVTEVLIFGQNTTLSGFSCPGKEYGIQFVDVTNVVMLKTAT